LRSFVDLYFAPGPVTPLEIAERIRGATGLSFVQGPHDLVFEWSTVEEFRALLAKLHEALRGSGAFYRVETVAEEEGVGFVAPLPWPPTLPRSPPSHPGF
jgi:hypothetical protein